MKPPISSFNKKKEWTLITFVPDGVPVKSKMLYASAKGTLKDKLGHGYFVEEVHITSKDDFNYNHYKGEQKPGDSRSNFEIERDKVIQQEDNERKELAEEMVKKEAQGSPGGLHSVSIPLNSSAKAALDRLNSGEVNFISLVVEGDKSSISSTDAKKIESSTASSEIHKSEPRFYILTQFGKQPVFIYSCPGISPPKLKMVYSTSKSNIINQITQYGINLAPKKIEITDPSDLNDELKDAQTVRPKSIAMTGRMIQPAPGSTPALGGTVKASTLPTMNNQHAIYGLMARPGTEGSSTKKKIVIPPRAAWNG